MKIKVCGMRDPGNIQQLLDRVTPDWMGLIFYEKSPRFVSESLAEKIKVFPVNKVGVFVNESSERMLDFVTAFGLHSLQLHGQEPVSQVRELRENTELEIFKVFSVSDQVDWKKLEDYEPWVDYFLFDTFTVGHGGSGKAFNWQILLDYPLQKPFLLSGGIGLEESDRIIELGSKINKMAGVDVNSKFEWAVAEKNIGALKQFKDNLLEK